MSVPFSAFYDDIIVHANGLTPGAHLDQHIRKAAIDFCRRSRVIRDEVTLDVEADVHTYTIPGSHVVQIETALYDDDEIDPTTERAQTARYSKWRGETGTVEYFLRPTKQTIRLIRIPTAALPDGLVLTVSICPAEDATDLDDLLLEDHRQAIAHGALGKILLEPKPWKDREAASYHMGQFGIEIGRAHFIKFNDNTRAPRENRTIGGIN